MQHARGLHRRRPATRPDDTARLNWCVRRFFPRLLPVPQAIAHVALLVPDSDEALVYYRDVLKFTVLADDDDDPSPAPRDALHESAWPGR